MAAELRAERAAQAITVQRLADISGVAYASLRRYLAAERHIDMGTLDALAMALGITPASVIEKAQNRMTRVDLAFPGPGFELADDYPSADEVGVDFPRVHEVRVLKPGTSRIFPSRGNLYSFDESDEAARNEDGEKSRIE